MDGQREEEFSTNAALGTDLVTSYVAAAAMNRKNQVAG